MKAALKGFARRLYLPSRRPPEMTVNVHVDPSWSPAQLEALADEVQRRLLARQRRNGRGWAA